MHSTTPAINNINGVAHQQKNGADSPLADADVYEMADRESDAIIDALT